MKRDISMWVRRSAAALAIAGGLAGGCSVKDPEAGSFLIVGFARTQPKMEDKGVTVVVQEGGGAFLRLRTSGGTHQFTTSTTLELPWGRNRRWLSFGGPLAMIVGDWSLSANLVVNSGTPLTAMNESVRAVAAERFDGRDISEGLLNEIEVAIRAYDPCLSCATHALGSMPLQVDLVDQGGALRSRLTRHGDGRFERA